MDKHNLHCGPLEQHPPPYNIQIIDNSLFTLFLASLQATSLHALFDKAVDIIYLLTVYVQQPSLYNSHCP